VKGEIYMKKTYAKPGLESRTFAQFENVFTACSKNTNNDKFGCFWCTEFNPGDDSKPCVSCGEMNDEHSRHANPGGS